MKINSMKFLLSVLLIFLIAGFGAGLIFIEIPSGNKEVVISLVSALTISLVTLINSLIRKPNE